MLRRLPFVSTLTQLLSSAASCRRTHTEARARLVCISDTHSRYSFGLPDGDILLHAGDFSRTGTRKELEELLHWLKTLSNFRLKIIIAGNHDTTLDEAFYHANWQMFHNQQEDAQAIIAMFKSSRLREDYGIIYLQDETFVDPQTQLKFYGSPWQPEFCAWAFNVKRDSEEIRDIWEKIPLDTDVLLTHGPPFGILDTTTRHEHVGCKALYERVQLVKPRLHVFGHIHEAYGKHQDGEQTIYVNAATCDKRYEAVQRPIVVEL